MLDIFQNDAFTVHSLTEAINIVPFVPKRLGAMGIFEKKNPRTNTVFLERKGNIISLLPTKPRGTGETTKRPASPRDILPISIPYIPYDDAVLAQDLEGIREFDSEDALETVSGIVNEKLQSMRVDHEATHEYHRIGALKGIILDADASNSVLANLFTIFGITQQEYYFDLAGDGDNIKQDCIDIIRYIEDVLGGAGYDHIHAMVGNGFFDKLTQNEEVSAAYSEQTSARNRIETQGQGTPGRGTSIFTFGDITFENYRGKVGSTAFIGADDAHFFPVGVPGLFRQFFGPAQTITDVNKPGRDIYAMQERMKWDQGIELHSESNTIALCTRPKLLVKGHAGTDPG